MDIFNNREVAIGFWLLVISVYVLLSPQMGEVRSSFRQVLSAFFVRKIMLMLGLMVAYMMFVVYCLYGLDLWNAEQIKNTIFWCVSVGFMSLFKIESAREDKSFFKHSVLDNLKLLAILQFVVGFYTFPVWIEVVLVPVVVVISVMIAIAEIDKKHHQVKVLLEYFLSVFGVVLIVYAIYMLVTSFDEFANEKSVYDFFVPPLLTLFYLPFFFFMLAYSTYEYVFIRLQFSIVNKLHRNLAIIYAMVLLNFRLSLLDRWSYHVARVKVKSHADLVESFRHIFKVRRAESNPIEVQVDLGWSPYQAKEFLVCEGLGAGFYNNIFEEKWLALSPMEEFSDGIIPDNISYYVEGSEEVVKVLKLVVNVNDAARAHQACRKLESMAESLSLSSLGLSLSEEMKHALSCCNPYTEKVEGKTMALIVEPWPDHKFNGFGLSFMISSI